MIDQPSRWAIREMPLGSWSGFLALLEAMKPLSFSHAKTQHESGGSDESLWPVQAWTELWSKGRCKFNDSHVLLGSQVLFVWQWWPWHRQINCTPFLLLRVKFNLTKSISFCITKLSQLFQLLLVFIFRAKAALSHSGTPVPVRSGYIEYVIVDEY